MVVASVRDGLRPPGRSTPDAQVRGGKKSESVGTPRRRLQHAGPAGALGATTPRRRGAGRGDGHGDNQCLGMRFREPHAVGQPHVIADMPGGRGSLGSSAPVSSEWFSQHAAPGTAPPSGACLASGNADGNSPYAVAAMMAALTRERADRSGSKPKSPVEEFARPPQPHKGHLAGNEMISPFPSVGDYSGSLAPSSMTRVAGTVAPPQGPAPAMPSASTVATAQGGGQLLHYCDYSLHAAPPPDSIPRRPTTPCMNQSGSGGSKRSKRTTSASSTRGRQRSLDAAGSLGARISELESSLVAAKYNLTEDNNSTGSGKNFLDSAFGSYGGESHSGRESVLGAAPSVPGERPQLLDSSPQRVATSGRNSCCPAASSEGRPTSSSTRRSHPAAARRPTSSYGKCSRRPATAAAAAQGVDGSPDEAGTDGPVGCHGHPDRPAAPTPEHTNHWLHDIDRIGESSQAVAAGDVEPASLVAEPLSRRYSGSTSSDSPREMKEQRPRSPTPTKMLAWEEEHGGKTATGSSSPCDSEHEGRGDHMDGLIGKLIYACQMNDVRKAFSVYDKLKRLKVPLYEGVYKLIIECCIRTHQLGLAMQCYETLRKSGQRISARVVGVLIEGCVREQHSEKILGVWKDWCPGKEAITSEDMEVLLLIVSGLIRTLTPDLAHEVLSDAASRSPQEGLPTCLADREVALEELLHLNEAVTEEAGENGTVLGRELLARFTELHRLLEDMWQKAREAASASRPASGGAAATMDDLFMEDVDLDLDLDLADA